MPVWHEGDRLGSEIEPLKGTTMALRTAIHRRALAGAIGRRSRGFARGALVAGVLAIALVTALAPELALAAEPTEVTFQAEERALSLSGDWGTAFWATIGGTLAIRAFCCWVLAGAVAEESPAFYLAALGCLVASKAYGVTRASAVPRLLPEEFTLVKANSRISLTGTAAAAVSAPLAVGAAALGAEWSLRYAFVLFVVGTVLAVLLPARVDSSEGEEQVDLSDLSGRPAKRGITVSRHVVDALRSNAGLRLITGFLTIFMAFTLREPPASLA